MCNKTRLKRPPIHLNNIHKLTGEEREQELKNANYILPAESLSSATNTDFVKEESFPCTSEECGKDSYMQERLKKYAKVLDQDTKSARGKDQ